MIRLSSGLRRAIISTTGLGSMLNGGRIDIYSGPQPESADLGAPSPPIAVVTQDGSMASETMGLLLAQGDVAGTLVHNGLWIMTGLAAGTASWWRFSGAPYDDGTATSTFYPRLDGAIGEGFEADGLPAITPEAAVEVLRFLITLPANN